MNFLPEKDSVPPVKLFSQEAIDLYQTETNTYNVVDAGIDLHLMKSVLSVRILRGYEDARTMQEEVKFASIEDAYEIKRKAENFVEYFLLLEEDLSLAKGILGEFDGH